MSEAIENWLRAHEHSLEFIAADAGISDELVHLAAVLVLQGLDDPDVLHELSHHILVMDGRHDPLARLEEAVHRLRRIVTPA